MLKIEYTEADTQGHENLRIGGEQFPHKIDTNRNMHRIYSHPLCPYAEKARLVFRAKGIKHQIVDVDLTGKPDWFVETGGAVPVVETPEGDLIPESDVIIEYANTISQDGIEIVPSDPVKAAKLRVQIKRLDDGFLLPAYMSLLNGKQERILRN